jgi:hypothetical protein
MYIQTGTQMTTGTPGHDDRDTGTQLQQGRRGAQGDI